MNHGICSCAYQSSKVIQTVPGHYSVASFIVSLYKFSVSRSYDHMQLHVALFPGRVGERKCFLSSHVAWERGYDHNLIPVLSFVPSGCHLQYYHAGTASNKLLG